MFFVKFIFFITFFSINLLAYSVIDNNDYIYNNGNSGEYVIKYDSNSNKLWEKIQSGYSREIQIDKNNNIYHLSNNYPNISLTKYDSEGNLVWSKKFNDSFDNIGDNIAIDVNSNIFIVGKRYDNKYKNFIAKYDSNGNQLWITNMDREYGSGSGGFIIDKAGNPIFFGKISGEYTSTNILKYDTNGNKIFKKIQENLSMNYILIDENNNLYITGSHKMDGGTLEKGDFFISKYDSNLNLLWSNSIIDNRRSYGHTIIFDEANNICVIGNSYSKEFDGHSNTNGSFFIKYDIDGNKIFSKFLKEKSGLGEIIIDSTYKAFFVKNISTDVNNQKISLVPLSLESIIVNNPPTLTTKSITPNKIKSGENITFSSIWDDPENKYIVDVQVRYRKQGSNDWTTNVMSHKSGYTFEKEKAITGVIGIYDVEFMAKDADTPNGERTNDTGWLSGGSFEIEDDAIIIPIELPTLSLTEDINFGQSTTRSLNVTNTAKIKLEVTNATKVQVNFDGIDSYEVEKIINSDGEYEFSYLFKKSDYASDSSDFWKKELRFTATAYNSKGASNIVTTEKVFTIYDLNEWRAWQDRLEKDRIQAEIDDKTSDKEKALSVYRSGKELYATACTDAYKNHPFSNDKKPNDQRRILNGVKIHSDIADEKIIEGRGHLPDTSTFKIYVQYGTTTNYPAIVEVKYDIKGYPLDTGETRKKRKFVQNYSDKELAKSYLLQSILVEYFNGTCTETDSLEVIEQDVDVIEIVETDNFNIEEDIKKEVAFDTYAGLSFDDSLMILLSEDKLFKEFLFETDYYTDDERDVLVAYYHYERWWDDMFGYDFPERYIHILNEERLKRQIITIFHILVPSDEVNAFSVKTPSKIVEKVKKYFSKKVLKVIVGNTKSTIKRGISTHKKWETDKLYDKKYGGIHQHEFPLPRPGVKTKKGYEAKYRLDAIHVDNKNEIITIRELKPDNYRAINKGNRQLETYKEQFEKLIRDKHPGFIKYKNFTINKGYIDVYK